MSRPHRAASVAMTPRIAVLVVALAALLHPYLCVRSAFAQVAVGATAGDFLSFEVGGRPAGMAGANTAVATGVTSQYWNPAGPAAMTQSQVGAMHANWLQDLSYEWLGMARPMGGIGVGSLSIAYFHMPSLQAVDAFDNPIGDFRVYDLAITAGLARSLAPGFSVGANAKMIRQSLGTVSASAPAVDFGARYIVAGTSLAAAVQNLGPSLSFDGSPYPLPRVIKFGAGRSFWNDRVQLAADYNMPRAYFNDLRLGTEIRAHPMVSLRVGYRHEFGTPEDPANGMSYGVGLHFHQIELDYAMTPSNQFDDVHRLSFGYSFGGGVEEKKPEQPKPEPPPPPAPTGPKVIAQGPMPPASAPSAPAKASVKNAAPSASAPAAKTPAPQQAVAQAAPAAEPKTAPATAAAKPAKPRSVDYAVILPGYWTQESAQAELKALELLGFKVKDAHVEKAESGSGYQIRLVTLRSKSSADDMAASLTRMSFRASVEVAER
jgi:uncharacterized protein UPF0164